jgi:hypothetical protein
MVNVGDTLIYKNDESIISTVELEVGEEFELISIEKTFANIFYWIENGDKSLVLLNDEINSFDLK